MTTSAKIRVMLALLFASLLFTAIIVRQTYTDKNNLVQTAETLQDNLHKKEQFVSDVFNDNTRFNQLKTLQDSDKAALQTIKDFTTDQSIWLVTYKNGRLAFWSGIKVIPDRPDLIHEGFSFFKGSNGYYDVLKKTRGDFSALAFIPVKIDYPFQNQYLKNTFASNLLNDNNISIADFSDKNIFEVHSIDQKYLFSVKLNPNQVSHKFFYFEMVVWSLCFMILCLLVHNCCNYIATKGYVYISFAILALFIVLLRILNLYYSWPDFTYRPEIFNAKLYAYGNLFPAFGDFCINILAVSWLVCFVYRYRDKLVKHISNRPAGYAITLGCISLLVVVSTILLQLFYNLVMYSKINFDVNNVLNLSVYSMLGVLMLCFAFLIFYVLVEICLTLCNRIETPAYHQAVLLILVVLIVTVISALNYGEFTSFYVLWLVWVLIRGYAYHYKNARLNSGALVSIILVCAIVSALKLDHFQSLKERKNRKELVQQLENPDDQKADKIFKVIEKGIRDDNVIRRYFADSVHNGDYLKDYIQKLYLNGYLARYNAEVYTYDDQDRLLSASGTKKYERGVFKGMMEYSANKVSDNFSLANGSFGTREYFAQIPVSKGENNLGTLVIDLTSRAVQAENTFPEILVDGDTEQSDDFKDYSYAFYADKMLKAQRGKYDYSFVNNEFKGKVKDYVYKTTSFADPIARSFWATYSHLIYQPNDRSLLVVSIRENPILDTLTSVTFFFIVFLVFSVLSIITSWLWSRIRILYIENNYFHWALKINLDNILYKTRIQFSIVFAVVITLVLVGVITYASIARQYDEQQDITIGDRVTRIGKAFETTDFVSGFNHIDQDFQTRFNQFANTYSADLTLYSKDGAELVSTQPKIYNYRLITRRINGKAYVYLHKLQKTEFVNKEIMGALNYKAGYVPIKDAKSNTIGYLELPYFSNEMDYRTRLGSLLNAMINIYALIFIAIGLLAIIIARQITNPLNFIEHSLSRTIYGQKNEPIKWSRNDEIGALVREYNTMIAALEQSAQKLAQSERESAWREMAKQVAHEIKNPLTPLKLGLQLLEKSWRDKDPKFDQKFERFSKSFVEQIESLSSIASEFSAFAKMPDTRIERMDVFEVLTQAVVVYKQTEDIRIGYQAPEKPFFISADRDQLLRCFNNLLKNAIEAIPHGTQGAIEINYLLTSKNILLSIKDNGNGIAEHLRGKIFEPNFTTKSSGTGLGLAFVKNSIENAGGKVWFETAVGTGTTFYISLPEAS
ncbi:MAG: ATP-binding protein [Sphingobacteriales bacterium]